MSAEARTLELIEAAVRKVAAPLEKAVEELSARLAAVEGSGGDGPAEASKRPARGRATKTKPQAAEVSAITGDGVQVESTDNSADAATDGPTEASEKVPEQRKGSVK